GDMFADDRAEELAGRISAFVAEQGGIDRVGFAEAIPPDDSRFAAPWVEEGAPFFPFMRMWDEGFPAYSGQQWLTSRFHFHLLAAAAGAQGTVLNAREGYYDVKHDLLSRLGTGWSRVDASAAA